MAFANLDHPNESVDTSNDSIVIMKYLDGIEGGCTLDVTGFVNPEIKAGHIVIVADATKQRKPMPVDGDEYDDLPKNHSYKGVTVATVKTSDPRVGVMTRGKVNVEASPYPVTEEMIEALHRIEFTKDE